MFVELATLNPGYTLDKDAASLGRRLILRPRIGPRRSEILTSLPRLHLPEQSS